MPCDPIWQPRAHWEILEVEEPAVELRAFPAGRSMADLLHLGAAGLSRLAVRAEPAGLPTGDRARLQGLRERIAAWLEDPSGAPVAGRHHPQERLDFAPLQPGGSQRPGVGEHDRGQHGPAPNRSRRSSGSFSTAFSGSTTSSTTFSNVAGRRPPSWSPFSRASPRSSRSRMKPSTESGSMAQCGVRDRA